MRKGQRVWLWRRYQDATKDHRVAGRYLGMAPKSDLCRMNGSHCAVVSFENPDDVWDPHLAFPGSAGPESIFHWTRDFIEVRQ